MTRQEFPGSVKKAAMERSGGVCEASGSRYGLEAGQRCTTPIAKGRVQFDHWPRGAHDPHPDTRSLANCVACCPAHNQWAANHFDKQAEQRIKNLSYEEALHQAKMQRKAGMDVPDPPKPRGKQAAVVKIPQPKNFKWPRQSFSKRP